MPDWDLSQVKDMNNAFQGKTNFNGDVSNWDVSSVTDIFNYATSFKQPIGNWEVSQNLKI